MRQSIGIVETWHVGLIHRHVINQSRRALSGAALPTLTEGHVGVRASIIIGFLLREISMPSILRVEGRRGQMSAALPTRLAMSGIKVKWYMACVIGGVKSEQPKGVAK